MAPRSAARASPARAAKRWHFQPLLPLLLLLVLPARAHGGAAAAGALVDQRPRAPAKPNATAARHTNKSAHAAAVPAAADAERSRRQEHAWRTRLGAFAGRKITVCTAETVPIVYCVGRKPEEFTGYEIQLFWRVAKDLGWREDDVTISCIDWDEMLKHLRTDDGVCDMAIGGMDISEEKLKWGLTYTTTTIRSGYRILVSSDSYRVSYFVFLDAFDPSLWAAILLTCVTVGVVLWLIDPWASKGGKVKPTRRDYQWRSLRSRVWATLANSMNFSAVDIQSKHTAGAIIILTFCFMMLVLMSLFTANTAANLTANRLKSKITGWQDLPGTKVATWGDKEYLTDLGRRGITAIPYPWNDEKDQDIMFDAVGNGTVDALVLDSYVLEFGAASRCDVTVVGQPFDQYEAGFAFPAGFNDTALLRRMNLAIVSVQETGDMEQLFNEWVQPPPPACKLQDANTDQNRLGFVDVMGLWIMLACGIAAALAVTAASRVLARSKPKISQAVSIVRSHLSGTGISQLAPLGAAQLAALRKAAGGAGGAARSGGSASSTGSGGGWGGGFGARGRVRLLRASSAMMEGGEGQGPAADDDTAEPAAAAAGGECDLECGQEPPAPAPAAGERGARGEAGARQVRKSVSWGRVEGAAYAEAAGITSDARAATLDVEAATSDVEAGRGPAAAAPAAGAAAGAEPRAPDDAPGPPGEKVPPSGVSEPLAAESGGGGGSGGGGVCEGQRAAGPGGPAAGGATPRAAANRPAARRLVAQPPNTAAEPQRGPAAAPQAPAALPAPGDEDILSAMRRLEVLLRQRGHQ